MSLLESQRIFKPFRFPWAYEAWSTQQKIHWLAEEVSLADDVRDWKTKLTQQERNLLTQIFRFFTQSDIEVADNYMTRLAGVFKPVEVQMMLAAFANTETIHLQAYSHLLDTVGMPEIEYSAFLRYKEMKDKVDFYNSFQVTDRASIAKILATFGGFTEGVSLFASFVILLNFTRFNKMRGMGQIISWSVRDESLHCENMIKLFRAFIQENPDIWTDELKRSVYETATKTVELEDAFIDLAFEQGAVEGLTADEVKQYIRYIADRRLIELGMKSVFHVRKNPLQWVDALISGVEHVNFFENRATAYAKSATTGSWDEAFDSVFGDRVAA